MVKPFSLEELTLRIMARVQAGRPVDVGGNSLGSPRNSGTDRCFQFGGIKIAGRYLVDDGASALDSSTLRRVLLTDKERDILLLLARNEGRVFSFSEIYSYIWDEPDNNDIRPVQSHVHNLRKKLESAYGKKDCIRTRWGKGYVFHSK